MTTAPSVSLAPNQSLVTFTVTTGSGKDLSFWNGCVPGEVAKLHESGASGAPVTLLIQRPASNDRLHGVDTVVFRKPGFLGIWSDVAHLDPDTFWALAGGRTVTFSWVRD